MRFVHFSIIALALLACNEEPATVTPVPQPEVEPPVRILRLAELNKADGRPARIFMDAAELKGLMEGMEEVPYDPAMPDSLFKGAVGYTPIDPDRPDLGGTLDIPCGRMCKDENFVYSCECPPGGFTEPSPNTGSTTITPGRCVSFTQNGVFRCLSLRGGCICRTRSIRLPLGRRVFYCACS